MGEYCILSGINLYVHVTFPYTMIVCSGFGSSALCFSLNVFFRPKVLSWYVVVMQLRARNCFIYMYTYHFVVHVDLGMGMWGFIFLTTVLGMCSQFCMTIGMQHEKSARATLMRMSDVIGAFTWQILFTHDKVNRYSASGMSYHCCYLIVVSYSCNYMFVRRRVNFLRSAYSGHI